jgi:hypothetical protein
VTLYNDVHLFHPNPLGRYSLGTKNKNLKYNADGSLTLYTGSKSPGQDKESNWLPAPEGTTSVRIGRTGLFSMANGSRRKCVLRTALEAGRCSSPSKQAQVCWGSTTVVNAMQTLINFSVRSTSNGSLRLPFAA